MRISIIGQPASGKSFLAQKIERELGIPHLHIDRFYFEARRKGTASKSEAEKERVRAYVREKVEKFIAADAWVSDGWYTRIQPTIAERSD